ncbi:hypothetical protein ACFFUA_34780 [Streptomyces heliomycini]|uniref:Acetyltransferase n=1 Tax=Streptomyces heliomycini TaxID=284032 RepID=A0ABV5LK15_9ACTN|nr:hypothetical protein ADK58_01030 [Streptomyces sp. XY152]
MAQDDGAEREVHRRMAAHELCTDSAPGLDRLEEERLRGKELAAAGAVVLPGVTVGRGSVGGAGSVVTADVPPMTVVAGTPARVLRPITDADRGWTYRPPRTARA